MRLRQTDENRKRGEADRLLLPSLALKLLVPRQALPGNALCVFERDLHFTCGAFVQMAFAGKRDGQADGGAVAGGEDVVEGEGRGEDEVALLRDDQFFAAFHLPVYLPFENDPPFVVVVDVIIGLGAGLLADEDAAHVIRTDDLVNLVGVALVRLDFVQTDVVEGLGENGVFECHDCSTLGFGKGTA